MYDIPDSVEGSNAPIFSPAVQGCISSTLKLKSVIVTKPDATPEPLHPPSYRLPYELERQICNIVAQSFPESIPNLILIARRFKIWFEPQLYRILRVGDGRVIPPLYTPSLSKLGPHVLDKPRIRQFGEHVRHALLQKQTPADIVDILKCCPNVSNLALWMVCGPCAPLIPILEKMPLRKFSFNPSRFFLSAEYPQDVGIPFNQPMFLNLTHLHIMNVTPPWSKWQHLALLPKLTHLALAGSINHQFRDRLLEECRTLELFIIFYFIMKFLHPEMTSQERDDRIVLLKFFQEPLNHWEKGARGEEDFWVTGQIRKEEAIEARRRRAVFGLTTGLA